MVKKAFKWLVIALLVVVFLALGGFVTVAGLSKSRVGHEYALETFELPEAEGSGDLAEGERLYRAWGCIDCHGEDLGGKLAFEGGPLGTSHGTNLTTGEHGIGGDYTDEDMVRALVSGVRPDGTPLLFMPSHEYRNFPDAQIAQLIAYIRTVEPVDREPGESRIGPVGRILHVSGMFPMVAAELIDFDQPRDGGIAVGPTAEYGAAIGSGCTGCHGATLSGGRIPGAPAEIPAPQNLTPHESGLADWTFEEFDRAMREGISKDGRQLDEFMPYGAYQHMTEVEIQALWAWLETVPPKEAGGR